MPRGRKPGVAPPKTTAQRLDAIVKSARAIMRKDKGLNGDLDRLPMLTWVMFLKFLDDMERLEEDEAVMEGRAFRPAIEPPYRWRDWAAAPDGITGPDLLAFITAQETARPNGTRGPGLFAHLRTLRGQDGLRDRRDVVAIVFRGLQNRMESGYLLRDVVNLVHAIHFDASDEIHTLSRLYEGLLREMRDAAGDSGEFYTPRPVVRLMVGLLDPRLGETVLDPACGTGGFLGEAFDHLSNQADTVEKRKRVQRGSLRGGEAKSLPYLLAQMNLLLHGLEAPAIDPGNALRFRLAEIGESDRVDVILTNPPFGGEEEAGILTNFPDDRRTAETALLFLQVIMRRLRRNGRGRAAVVVPNGMLFGDGIAARIKGDLLGGFNLHTIVRLPEGVFAPYTDIPTNILFFDTSGPTDAIWYWQHPLPEGRRRYTKTMPIQAEEFADMRAWWADRQEGPNAWRVPAAGILCRDEAGRVVAANLDLKNPHSRDEADHRAPAEIVASTLDRQRKTVFSLEDLQSLICEGTKEIEPTWPKVALGKLLSKNDEWIIIDPETQYQQITARLWGKGLTLRGVVSGSSIAANTQIQVHEGQFLVSRIDARHGAFGLVPSELEGAVTSGDFPTFNIDTHQLEPRFLEWMSRTDWFVALCRAASEGSTNRVRLKEDRFLAQSVPLPPLPDQRRILTLLDTAAEQINVQKKLVEEFATLLPALLQHAFGGDAEPTPTFPKAIAAE